MLLIGWRVGPLDKRSMVQCTGAGLICLCLREEYRTKFSSGMWNRGGRPIEMQPCAWDLRAGDGELLDRGCVFFVIWHLSTGSCMESFASERPRVTFGRGRAILFSSQG